MKILFLTPYPIGQAPSQRFRLEQYFTALKQEGHEFRIQSFLNAHYWRLLYSGGMWIQKLHALLSGFLKRTWALVLSIRYDIVFIHRELTPVGQPIFEWVLASVLRKKIIYDFDDAIWLTDREGEGWLTQRIRWRSKVGHICKWSYKVSCGNAYLADYARRFNPSVVINPTTVDTEHVHNPDRYEGAKSPDKITIGWTGSHSTLKYLSAITDVIRKLEGKYPTLNFLVIADRKPNLQLERCEFTPWRKETEAQDLMKIDIGIMPLPDDEWAKGKCGFKALQYMAMRIPCVVSPVGVNPIIVEHGQTGFLASSPKEWMDHLERLINDHDLRKSMGIKGRDKVIADYSVVSNTANFLALFE